MMDGVIAQNPELISETHKHTYSQTGAQKSQTSQQASIPADTTIPTHRTQQQHTSPS